MFKSIVSKTLNGRGCAQLKNVWENQNTISEPLWRAGLSIAKFCKDAAVAAVKISEQHQGYDHDEMQRKLSEIKGPYTCDKFDELNPNVCGECPFKGKIKSPITLGQKIKEASGPVEVKAKSMLGGPVEKTFSIPVFPRPYFRGETGGVYYAP